MLRVNTDESHEAREWEEERSEFVMKVEKVRTMLGDLERQKRTAVEQSARAFISGQPFDLNVLTELDNRLVQVRFALPILEAEFHARFERISPPPKTGVKTLYLNPPNFRS